MRKGQLLMCTYHGVEVRSIADDKMAPAINMSRISLVLRPLEINITLHQVLRIIPNVTKKTSPSHQHKPCKLTAENGYSRNQQHIA